MTREEYGTHLSKTVAHDGSYLPEGRVKPVLETLPPTLWVVEFTLPDLFTGNHSKLGEVLFDASKSSANAFEVDSLCGVRMPSCFMLAHHDRSSSLNEFLENRARLARGVQPFPIDSHSPLYERTPPPRQW